ncbi:hypothetical protein F4823DRAFT_100474 [Ustulina deusta]|nr:hypothetical protein F4823DRAFT_100474 [Ustulina deusta]
MSSNTCEMDGSPVLFPPYELGNSNQMNNCHFEIPENQLPAYQLHSQLELSQWPQGPDLRPAYYEGMATDSAPDPNCVFRSEVLDDCAKARFYARALEIYLLDNENQDAKLRCPLAACKLQFHNPRDMLRHLKHCKKFADGKFWCPTCHRYESFRLRTGKRCSWDKDHLGRKLLQKSKSIFCSFGSNDLVTQPTSIYTQCPLCSAQLSNLPMPGSGDVPPHQVHPIPSTQLATPLNQPQLVIPNSMPPELYECALLSELSGDSSCENSPSQSWLGPEYTHTRSASAVSSVSTSSDGTLITTDISPASSTSGGMTPSTRRPRSSASILNKATNRVAGFYGEADAGNRLFNQSCVSAYSDVSTSHAFRPPVSTVNASNSETFATPSASATTFTRHASFRVTPKLRIDTPQDGLDLAMPIPGMEMLFQASRTFDHSPTTENLTATSLSTGAIDTQPSELSIFDTMVSRDDFFVAQPTSPMVPSPPVSATSTVTLQSSPTAVSPNIERRCEICDWKPKQNKQAYLNKHMKTHGNRSPIPCPGDKDCGVTFTRRDNLQAHLRTFHPSFTLIPSKRRRESSDSLQLAPKLKKKYLCTKELE